MSLLRICNTGLLEKVFNRTFMPLLGPRQPVQCKNNDLLKKSCSNSSLANRPLDGLNHALGLNVS